MSLADALAAYEVDPVADRAEELLAAYRIEAVRLELHSPCVVETKLPLLVSTCRAIVTGGL